MRIVIEIRRYTTAEGRDVFGEWLVSLADLKARARIAVRIDRLAGGNFGDSKSTGVAGRNVHLARTYSRTRHQSDCRGYVPSVTPFCRHAFLSKKLHGIEAGRGGVWLRLRPEQYARGQGDEVGDGLVASAAPIPTERSQVAAEQSAQAPLIPIATA
jgi:hypothetical protein